MSKPEISPAAGRRMSPALASYLQRTAQAKPPSKIMSLFRPK